MNRITAYLLAALAVVFLFRECQHQRATDRAVETAVQHMRENVDSLLSTNINLKRQYANCLDAKLLLERVIDSMPTRRAVAPDIRHTIISRDDFPAPKIITRYDTIYRSKDTLILSNPRSESVPLDNLVDCQRNRIRSEAIFAEEEYTLNISAIGGCPVEIYEESLVIHQKPKVQIVNNTNIIEAPEKLRHVFSIGYDARYRLERENLAHGPVAEYEYYLNPYMRLRAQYQYLLEEQREPHVISVQARIALIRIKSKSR